MNRKFLPALLLMALTVSVLAQEPVPGTQKEENGTQGKDWLSAGGYATWLHTAMFEDPADDWVNSSMLHNRLNFKAYAGNNTTFALEIRNRFVTGDMVRYDPTYVPGLST